MTNMYLLWEWAGDDNREGKVHHGVFSTEEKAKAAALLAWKAEVKKRGAADEELDEVKLEWKDPWETGESGFKVAPDDEDLFYGDDSDTPYEIDTWVLDRMTTYGEYDKATRKLIAEHTDL